MVPESYFTFLCNNIIFAECFSFFKKQGRKRPLDTPKRMIERRERERERKVQGEI